MKAKLEKFEKVFEIMGIYIKMMLDIPITREQKQLMMDYSHNSIYKPSQPIMMDTNYLDSRHLCMGDMVLQFKNPDIIKNPPLKVVSFSKAMEFFDMAVGSRQQIQFLTERLDNAILRYAFICSFQSLANAKEEDQIQPRLLEPEVLTETVKQFFKNTFDNYTKRNENDRDKERKHILNQYIEQVMQSKSDDLVGQMIEQVKQKIIQRIKEDQEENKQKSKKKSKQKDEYFRDSKEQKQQIKVQKKKIGYKGGFLKAGRGQWYHQEKRVYDFMTLARNIILLRLTQKGFQIRQFISAKFNKLYAVLYSCDKNLNVVAEIIKMHKFLNLEFTDLFSLEPVDITYRPLRLNNRFWRAKNISQYSTTEYFKYLQPKMIDLIKKINFRKMAKELNIQNLNDSMFSYGREDIIEKEQDPGPSDAQWEQFYEYLIYVDRHVQEARKEFYIKQDQAAFINPKKLKKSFFKRNNKKQKDDKKIVKLSLMDRIIFRILEFWDIKNTDDTSVGMTNKLLQEIINGRKLDKIEDFTDEYFTYMVKRFDQIIQQFLTEQPTIVGKKHGSSIEIDKLADLRSRLEFEITNPNIQKQYVIRRNRFLLEQNILERYKMMIRKQSKKWIDQDNILCDTMKIDFSIILEDVLTDISQKTKIEPDEYVLKSNDKNRYQLAIIKSLMDDDLVRFTNLFGDEFGEEAKIKTLVFERLIFNITEKEQVLSRSYSRQQTGVLSAELDVYKNIRYNIMEDLFIFHLKKEIDGWINQINQDDHLFKHLKQIMKFGCPYICTKLIKEKRREILAQKYGKILRDALEIVNYKRQEPLQTIWSIGDLQQVAISCEYLSADHKFNFKTRRMIQAIWKQYVVSESGYISIFSNMERIKLTNQILFSTINIPYLLNAKFLQQSFPLNDIYELTGESVIQYFPKRNLDVSDRSFVDSPTIRNSLRKAVTQIKFEKKQSNLIQPKLFNLREIWRFQISQPWNVPSSEIRDYYGEKIALYFSYIGHYTGSLLIPGFIGLGVTLLQTYATTDQTMVLRTIYGFYHTTYLTYLYTSWKNKEKQLQILFGQTQKDDDKKQLEQRPSFKGSYFRDPVTDQLNTLFSSFYELMFKIAINLTLLMMVFACYFGCVIGLFQFSYFLDEYDVFDALQVLGFLKLEAFIPAFINVIVLWIFNVFYEQLSEQLTLNENHRTVQDFESNFILKLFSLQMLSYFSPIFFITYLSNYLQSFTCSFQSCYLHACYYFSAIFLILFLSNIREIIKSFREGIQAPEAKQLPSEEDQVMDDQRDPNSFKSQNDFIESEAEKESYTESTDKYGTVDDYMEIIVQLGLLGFFGQLFPASLFIGFIWNVIEIQTDKIRLIKQTQRPAPQDESTIGIWNTLIEFLSNAGIIYNSAIIYLLGYEYWDAGFKLFLFVTGINIFIRFVWESLTPEVSYELGQIIKRQKYLLKSTIENFKSKENLEQKTDQSDRMKLTKFPIFKVYGTILQEKKKKRNVVEESISDISQDDVGGEQQYQNSAHDAIFMVAAKKPRLLMRKVVYCFSFPSKRFGDDIKEQKKYDDKINRLSKLLQSFERGYTLKWCEQRFIYRRFYVPRQLRIIKNLNVRKIKGFLKNYKNLFQKFYQMLENKRQKGLRDEQEDKERQIAIQKKTAKKRAVRNLRKVVIVRPKTGLWLNQYRLQTPHLKSKDLIKQLRKKYFEQQKKQSKFGTVLIQNINVNSKTLIEERWKIFNQIGQVDIHKVNSKEIIQLILKGKEDYQEQKLYKNTLVRLVEQDLDFKVRKLDLIQNYIMHPEFPSLLPQSQQEIKNLFFQVNQKNKLRQLKFQLIKQIEGQNSDKYPNLCKYFNNDKIPQRQVWLIQQDEQYKILEYIDIEMSKVYKLSYINNNLYYYQETLLLDNFIFPKLKGSVCRIQENKIENSKLLYGWTLRDSIKSRKEINHYYLDHELYCFMYQLLDSIKNYETQEGLYISSIQAYKQKNFVFYQAVWEIYGYRDINVYGYEFLCVSPEMLSHNGNPEKNKIYNVGMIILYMMTLGDAFDHICEKLETSEISTKRIIQCVADYMIAKQPHLLDKYPISYTILQDMLVSQSQRKQLGYLKQLCKQDDEENKLQFKPILKERKDISKQFNEQSLRNKLTQVDYVDLKLYDQNEMISSHQARIFHLELSQILFKCDIFYKLKLYELLFLEIDQTFKILKQSFGTNYFDHIQENFMYYVDRQIHQKILFDILNLHFYQQLYNFLKQTTMDDFTNAYYIPNIQQDMEFIDKIQRYTSEKCLTDYSFQNDILLVKKRLRQFATIYQNVNNKIQMLLSKYSFLIAYANTLAQNQQAALNELDLFEKAKITITQYQICQYLKILNAGNQYQLELLEQFPITNNTILNRKKDIHLFNCFMEANRHHDALMIPIANSECMFEQSLMYEMQIKQSEAKCCIDKASYQYDILIKLQNKYKQIKCNDLAIDCIIKLEKCVDILFYNLNDQIIQDSMPFLYERRENNILVNLVLFKIISIININQGISNSGLLALYHKDSHEAEKDLLRSLSALLPIKFKYKDDFTNHLVFQNQCFLGNERELHKFTQNIKNKQLVSRRFFWIAKIVFNKGQHEYAFQILSQCKEYNQYIVQAWQIKTSIYLNLFYDIKDDLKIHDHHTWSTLFITLIFDLKTLNAQLVCSVGLRLIDHLQTLQSSEKKTKELESLKLQFKICFVLLLLQEYQDQDNKYIQEQFHIKFQILQNLLQYLQELSLVSLKRVCEIEDIIQKKQLVNYMDPEIQEINIRLKHQSDKLNDLIYVQSSVLEESGDPIAALKCLDVDYAVILYDEKYSKQIRKVFSNLQQGSQLNFNISKAKIAIYQLILNIFQKSTIGMLKIQEQCKTECHSIVLEIAKQSQMKIQSEEKYVFKDEITINVLRHAKPTDLQLFQKYKFIFFQMELKLLESYSLQGDFKRAKLLYSSVANYYGTLIQGQNLEVEDEIFSLFEYNIGIYFYCIYDYNTARKFLFRADYHITKRLKESSKSALKYDEINFSYKAQKISFRDDLYNPYVAKDMFDQMNHSFTFKTKCRILLAKSQITNDIPYQLLSQIIQVLEDIRKTMGRQSILYAEALLVYTEYLLYFKENKKIEDLKLRFTTDYFQKSQDLFRPGIYNNDRQVEALQFVFQSKEEITHRFSEVLVTFWISDLLDQLEIYLRQYYKSININDHLNLINCFIQKHRLYFCQARIVDAQTTIVDALKSLEILCPSLNHPLAAVIYSKFANMCDNIHHIRNNNIDTLVKCPPDSQLQYITENELKIIVKGILMNDQDLNIFFDKYQSNQFVVFLYEKLVKYVENYPDIKKKTNKERQKIRPLSVADKEQIVQEVKIEVKIHEEESRRIKGLEKVEKVSKYDYLKVGTLGNFRKAYTICKNVFDDNNSLFMEVEKNYIEESRKENRDKLRHKKHNVQPISLTLKDYITEPTNDATLTDRTHLRPKIEHTKLTPRTRHYFPKSQIVQDEKQEFTDKIKLIDALTSRTSCEISFPQEVQTINHIQSPKHQNTIFLQRNQFHYTQIKILDRCSPIIITLKEIESQSKFRIFASVQFSQPNRFNAEIESYGKVLKYTSKFETFTDEFLFITILALQDVQFRILYEFSKPIKKSVHVKGQKQDELPQTPNLYELLEEIMERRRLKLGNQNYIKLNKDLIITRRKTADPTSDINKRIAIKSKVQEQKYETALKRNAQLKIHDVAVEIHHKQIQMQIKIAHRKFVQKSWLAAMHLVNNVVPQIKFMIDRQRTIVAKNMKKQIILSLMLQRMQRLIAVFGKTSEQRNLVHSRYCMKIVSQACHKKAKHRAKFIVKDLLKNNIIAYFTEKNGTYVVNLSMNKLYKKVKRCMIRLVKHKISRIQFFSDLKQFLAACFKQLVTDISRFSRQTDQKSKRDGIHFLLHDPSFVHQMSKKFMNFLYLRWNANFSVYRLAVQEQIKMGVALFLKPPKLFELPHDSVVRQFLFEEFEKRNLITSDYKN